MLRAIENLLGGGGEQLMLETIGNFQLTYSVKEVQRGVQNSGFSGGSGVPCQRSGLAKLVIWVRETVEQGLTGVLCYGGSDHSYPFGIHTKCFE